MYRFRPGELILQSFPYAFIHNGSLVDNVCATCFIRRSELMRCAGCHWDRYCNRACQKKSWSMHKHECKFLKRSLPKVPLDGVRLLFRIAVTFQTHKQKFLPNESRTLHELMSHSDKILNDPKRFEEFQRHCFTLHEMTSENKDLLPDGPILLELFGKMCMNSYTICDKEMISIGTGLYLSGSEFDHSCTPNAVVVFSGSTMSIRAIRQIDSGEQVFICYIDPLSTREERQKELSQSYYFDCTCGRCSESSLDCLDEQLCAFRCPVSDCSGLVSCLTNKGCCSLTDNHQISDDHIEGCSASRDLGIDLLAPLPKLISSESDHQKLRDYFTSCRDWLDHHSSLLHPFHVTRARILDKLFDLCIALELWDDAISYGLSLVDIFRVCYGANHTNTSLLLAKLGKIYLFRNQWSPARKFLLQASDCTRICFGEDHETYCDISDLLDQVTEEMRALSQKGLEI